MHSQAANSEKVYPLRLGRLITQAAMYFVLTLLSVGAALFFFLVEWSAGTGWSIGFGCFFGLMALAMFALFLDPVMQMPRHQRIAVGISDAGLRIPDAKGIVPWADIESILLVCIATDSGESAAVARVHRGYINHVRVKRRNGEAFVYAGPKARFYHIAYQDQLLQDDKSYLDLGRDLIAWGKAKGVRVALLTTPPKEYIRELLGHPEIADWSELEHNPTTNK